MSTTRTLIDQKILKKLTKTSKFPKAMKICKSFNFFQSILT